MEEMMILDPSWIGGDGVDLLHFLISHTEKIPPVCQPVRGGARARLGTTWYSIKDRFSKSIGACNEHVSSITLLRDLT